MANDEHVERLLGGVEAWNQWREEHPELLSEANSIDLSGADLRGIDLRHANLAFSNFTGAQLKGVNLSWANCLESSFRDADLHEAKLGATDLRESDCQGANFHAAILVSADLSGTNLSYTNLRGSSLKDARMRFTSLRRADVSHAIMGMTLLGIVDLSEVIGLDTVIHRGRSLVTIDALYHSKGQIPEVFLRGCGVPESMIEYARSLIIAERPIDYYSCFISYSSQDEALAERLYADLQAKGVRCWFAPHDLTPGSYIVRGIDEAIRLHDKVVLLLSESAVQSAWVEFEVQAARTREAREGRLVLYPVRLDDEVLNTAAGWAADLRNARHIGDFRQWKEHDAYQQAFARLLHDLRAGVRE